MSRLRLRTEGLKWREIDDEVIAVDIRGSHYLSTNASGKLLWRRLAEGDGATRAELVNGLTAEFGIDAERAAADVDRFLAELSAQGVLED